MTREAQEEMEKLGQRTWQLTQKATGVFFLFGGISVFFFSGKVSRTWDCVPRNCLYVTYSYCQL